MSAIACSQRLDAFRMGVPGKPGIHPGAKSESSIFVVFTSVNSTLNALEKAREMARSLRANVTVVAVQVVPYPVPLDEPPVPFEFVVRHFEEMTRKAGEPTQLSAYVCRDQVEALKRILHPGSPVLISVRKKLWPTREQKLARKLRHAGFDVISVHQE